MSKKDDVTEVSHSKTDNAGEGVAFLALGLPIVSYKADHEVAVERGDGRVGVGHGETHEEARGNAIRDTERK
jgi:hypothetical protein